MIVDNRSKLTKLGDVFHSAIIAGVSAVLGYNIIAYSYVPLLSNYFNAYSNSPNDLASLAAIATTFIGRGIAAYVSMKATKDIYDHVHHYRVQESQARAAAANEPAQQIQP